MFAAAARVLSFALDTASSTHASHHHVDEDHPRATAATISDSPWVVLKFGGSSVSSAADWQRIIDVLRDRLAQGLRPVVVHSALAGVTDQLEQLVVLAVRGDWQSVVEQIENQHRQLAHELAVAVPSDLEEQFKYLRQLAAGIELIGECSERLHARVLAQGELLATRLGATFLNARELVAEWVDARTVLQARQHRTGDARSRYLSASCAYEPNASLQQLWSRSGTVWITQGFIASDEVGDTVLLGRDGSDISASYLAAKLQARRLEIWTDVPGLFSADPRSVPTAHLLPSLEYGEAQEIASGGAKVLHPHCITPVKQYGIPLHVYGTRTPTLAGTVISAGERGVAEHVKAVTLKKNILLIVLENTSTGHCAGSLIDALQVFKEHGIAADLLSTCAASAMVAVEAANTLDRAMLDALVGELGKSCQVRILGPCAAVSMVGHNLQTILHRLGEALEVLDERILYLVTQGANGRHIKLWIEEARGDWLVARLHDAAIHKTAAERVLGPTWEELCSAERAAPSVHCVDAGSEHGFVGASERVQRCVRG